MSPKKRRGSSWAEPLLKTTIRSKAKRVVLGHRGHRGHRGKKGEDTESENVETEEGREALSLGLRSSLCSSVTSVAPLLCFLPGHCLKTAHRRIGFGSPPTLFRRWEPFPTASSLGLENFCPAVSHRTPVRQAFAGGQDADRVLEIGFVRPASVQTADHRRLPLASFVHRGLGRCGRRGPMELVCTSTTLSIRQLRPDRPGWARSIPWAGQRDALAPV